MAQARRRTTRYETYGSVAYEPAWEGPAVAVPEGGEQVVVRPRPKVRPKERTLARPRVQVREAGRVSPFSVVGFLTVGVLAVLLLINSVQLTVINDQSVQLRSELSQLQEEESRLLTKYEMAYDLRAIEEMMTADGTMVKPSSNQIVIMDLSEPDNIVIYNQTEEKIGLLSRIGGMLNDLLS